MTICKTKANVFEVPHTISKIFEIFVLRFIMYGPKRPIPGKEDKKRRVQIG